MGVENRHVVTGGKNIMVRRGGREGINIVFGPKYRPLGKVGTYLKLEELRHD
jgi:hypothetical protein